jgi:DNA-directed RNA polymerase specialized sigma24 family protein
MDTEVAMARTQLSSKERTTKYATSSDFCRIFEADMDSLYSLSLMLTADTDLAEKVFVSGLHDCSGGNPVFKEWARSWARRVIVKHAVRLIGPLPVGANSSSTTVASSGAKRAVPELLPEISAVLGLQSFERFAFILSVLEGYSDQDSALLLGCTRQALIAARIRATEGIARSLGVRDNRTVEATLKDQDRHIKATFPLPLPTPA